MTKIIQGAAALTVLLLTFHDQAQFFNSDAPGIAAFQSPPTPEPINLDVPIEEPADPETIQETQLAELAVLNPEEFHEWLLQIEPGRRGREERAAFSILNPAGYRRAHPKNQEQMQAELVAAQAIFGFLGLVPPSPRFD